MNELQTFELLQKYINFLVDTSTPEAPAWNIEKIRQGKPVSWNYIDGCMIAALLDYHELAGDERILRFCDAYISHFVSDDGSILKYKKEDYNLDNINAGKTLFTLYERTSTRKYRLAIDKIYKQIIEQPRTSTGNFWHKALYPNQVWLDGLYMVMPFYMQYELEIGDGSHISDIMHQFEMVHEYMRDARTGLYYHAWDVSKRQFWCDTKTGLSSNFWLRAEGWFAMALLDTWDLLPAHMSAERSQLASWFKELIDAMLDYQDAQTGMWYQVINLGRIWPNYLEASGSAIFAYALLKGVRTHLLDASYLEAGKRAFFGTCAECLHDKDGVIGLDNICLVAGLGNKQHRTGTFDYYMSEPVVKDDAKGVAPLVLAYVELLKLQKGAPRLEDQLAQRDPFGGYCPHINKDETR